jgi:hypothetical protein
MSLVEEKPTLAPWFWTSLQYYLLDAQPSLYESYSSRHVHRSLDQTNRSNEEAGVSYPCIQQIKEYSRSIL